MPAWFGSYNSSRSNVTITQTWPTRHDSQWMEPSIDRAVKLVKDCKFTAEDYGQYSMMKHKD